MKKISEEQLRVALGNALISLNAEILNNRTPEEKIMMNKLALKLISNTLTELGIEPK